jgi:large subunit ribosomal protein L18
VAGTAERPRLCVYRSLRHVYAQVVDDSTGRTLVAASTAEGQITAKGSNRTSAAAVGTAVAERAVAAGVRRVVFDRGGWSPKVFAEIIAVGFHILTYR